MVGSYLVEKKNSGKIERTFPQGEEGMMIARAFR